MDIEFMRTRTGFTNDSDFIDKGFLKNNLAVGIPYLIIVTGAIVYGCVGNVMVIGAVTMYKVGQPCRATIGSQNTPLCPFLT